MDTIKVDKQKLRNTMIENRKKHIEEHKKSHKKWLKAVQKELAKRLADAQEGKVDLVFQMPEPKSYAAQYDTALEKLDWELMDEVELDEAEFEQYVQDQWRWKAGFVQTASLYQ